MNSLKSILLLLLLSLGAGELWATLPGCEPSSAKVGLAAHGGGVLQPSPQSWRQAIEDFTAQTSARANGVTFPIKRSPGETKRVQFVVPHVAEGEQNEASAAQALQSFSNTVGKETVGLGFISGWFGDEPNRPPFHAYIRVGDKMIHLENEGKTVLIRVESYAERQKRVMQPGSGMVAFEHIFPMPPEERAALEAFYLSFANGTAKINGEIPPLEYSVGSTATYEPGKPLGLHCVNYSVLFTNPAWHAENPILKKITDRTGMGKATDEQGQISIVSVPESISGAKNPAVVVWGNDYSKFPLHDPTLGYLSTLRIVRVRDKLNIPPDFKEKNQLVVDDGLHLTDPNAPK